MRLSTNKDYINYVNSNNNITYSDKTFQNLNKTNKSKTLKSKLKNAFEYFEKKVFAFIIIALASGVVYYSNFVKVIIHDNRVTRSLLIFSVIEYISVISIYLYIAVFIPSSYLECKENTVNSTISRLNNSCLKDINTNNKFDNQINHFTDNTENINLLNKQNNLTLNSKHKSINEITAKSLKYKQLYDNLIKICSFLVSSGFIILSISIYDVYGFFGPLIILIFKLGLIMSFQFAPSNVIGSIMFYSIIIAFILSGHLISHDGYLHY